MYANKSARNFRRLPPNAATAYKLYIKPRRVVRCGNLFRLIYSDHLACRPYCAFGALGAARTAYSTSVVYKLVTQLKLPFGRYYLFQFKFDLFGILARCQAYPVR